MSETGQVAGSEQPVFPGAPVEVQVQNPDQTWRTAGTAAVAADGTFTVPVTIPAGTTYRIVVTPGNGYAPGTTAPQVATATG